MSRYIPSTDEQDAIDLLTSTGHSVLRRRSHDALIERARRAETLLGAEKENSASLREWAHKEAAEVRRLQDRLTRARASASTRSTRRCWAPTTRPRTSAERTTGARGAHVTTR